MELSPVLSMYKRYSKYTTQTHTCRPETPADFGQLVEMEIPRYGDFIKTIFVKMTLPPSPPNSLSNNPSLFKGYTGSPGLHIFEYIDLVIGDKVIERLDGYSMSLYFMKHYGPMYNDVFDETMGGNPEQHFCYTPYPSGNLNFRPTRNGKGAGNNVFVGLPNNDTNPFTNTIVFYPLPFYFFNNPSLALPICLLHKQEIKIRFKFRLWIDMFVCADSSLAVPTLGYIDTYGAGKYEGSYNNYYGLDSDARVYYETKEPWKSYKRPSLVDFSLPVEFAYISEDDYIFLNSKPCTYIINQTQRQLVEVESNVFNVNTRLEFINPVKCIDFFVKYKRNRGYAYMNLYNMKINYGRLLNATAQFHHIESIQLEFDGETFLSNSIANYQFLTYIQKYKHNLGFYNVTRSDLFQSWGAYSKETFWKVPNPGQLIYNDNVNPVYSKSVSGPFYSYSFALDPLSEKPCGYMNFSTIRNAFMKINMFSDVQTSYLSTDDPTLYGNCLSEARTVYIYASTFNILTFDPVKGTAALKFQNPTYT